MPINDPPGTPPPHWRTLDFWLIVAIVVVMGAAAYAVLWRWVPKLLR